MRILFGFVACLAISLAGANSACANWIYNANSDFKAFEIGNSGILAPSFSNFTAGYSQTLGGFTAFAATQHTDNWTSRPNAELQGWSFANNVSVPAVVVNQSGVSVPFRFAVDPDQIVMHPGGLSSDGYAAPWSNAVLRFTTTNAGIYSITGDWAALDVNKRISYVLKNGVILDTSTLQPSLDETNPANLRSTFSLSNISLANGDFIDFVVNDGGDGIGSDSTGLRATIIGVSDISAVPEPTTLTLFGLGGIGLAGIAKRRRARKVA
ncbi:MAG: PEP-CTERM sorting domain-containing protein [Pirellula sp.]